MTGLIPEPHSDLNILPRMQLCPWRNPLVALISSSHRFLQKVVVLRSRLRFLSDWVSLCEQFFLSCVVLWFCFRFLTVRTSWRRKSPWCRWKTGEWDKRCGTHLGRSLTIHTINVGVIRQNQTRGVRERGRSGVLSTHILTCWDTGSSWERSWSDHDVFSESPWL